MTSENTPMRNRALARFRAATSYWLATTRPDGRPHTAPIWGVWMDDAFWFGTSGQKASNLARMPYAVIHLDSGEDTVILEGEVTTIDAPSSFIDRVAIAYQSKYVNGQTGAPYQLRREIGTSGNIYRCDPERGHAWLQGAFEETLTSWNFPPVPGLKRSLASRPLGSQGLSTASHPDS